MNFVSILLLSLSFLCCLVTAAPPNPTDQYEWCMYWKLRGIMKPECKNYDLTRGQGSGILPPSLSRGTLRRLPKWM